MAAFAKQQNITYPVAADVGDKTTTAFRVDSFPDYYLIDRHGKLRVADLANGDLERAVQVLLAEKGPEDAIPLEEIDAKTALTKALAAAKKTERKVLVHVGGPG